LTAQNPSSRHIERDYLERTIATVRNHRDAENCWPQWANIFADEIERLWRAEDALNEIAAIEYTGFESINSTRLGTAQRIAREALRLTERRRITLPGSNP
jgi:hypothetical protein